MVEKVLETEENAANNQEAIEADPEIKKIYTVESESHFYFSYNMRMR
jgi:uncharacterized SAM-binding protein YcdF (DUF218 family)